MTEHLVFVHGFMGGGSQWAGQAKKFADRYEVWAPDLPGFADNHELEAPERIASFAEYVLSWLDERDVDQFNLVGHSMGGMVVQEMARIAPNRVTKLVLYGTGPSGNLAGRFETFEQSRKRALADGVSVTGKRISATWFLHGERAKGYPLCADLSEKSSMQAVLAALTAMENWNGLQNLSVIAMSTLILWGEADRTYKWEQIEKLWRGISSSHLAVIPQAAHCVHLEKPEIFNQILRDFLDCK